MMMFATLDDLEGPDRARDLRTSPPRRVPGRARRRRDRARQRARVDHKEPGDKTTIVVQRDRRPSTRHRRRSSRRAKAAAAQAAEPPKPFRLRARRRRPARHGPRGAQGLFVPFPPARPTWCSTIHTARGAAHAAVRRRATASQADADAAAPSSSAILGPRALSASPASRADRPRARQRRLAQPRSASPCLRSRLQSRISAARRRRFLPLRPGRLEHARQALEARLGQERARSPRAPISPSPTLAWRSRFEPSGVWLSLRCSEPSRSSPTTASKSSSTADKRPRPWSRRSPDA